jgi:hypothetical protein
VLREERRELHQGDRAGRAAGAPRPTKGAVQAGEGRTTSSAGDRHQTRSDADPRGEASAEEELRTRSDEDQPEGASAEAVHHQRC